MVSGFILSNYELVMVMSAPAEGGSTSGASTSRPPDVRSASTAESGLGVAPRGLSGIKPEVLLAEADKLMPDVIALRRKIHAHPELGNDLPQTRAAVLDALNDVAVDVNLSNSTSGGVAVMEGQQPGRTLLLRGDMDALPMPEDTGLPFASQHSGRMDACGHDAHTAMLVGAARLLDRHRDKLHGRVTFVCQSGEEGPGGAEPMVEEGILDVAGRADASFAIHIFPNHHAGHVATRPGALLAAADTVTIKVRGKGGHGSMPYDALDPVPVACEIVQALQTFVTRRFNVFDPVVITVGRIVGGTVDNVIPEMAEIGITLRTFSDSARNTAHEGIRRVASNVAAAHLTEAEVDIAFGYPSTHNDAAFVDWFCGCAERLLGEERVSIMPNPLMAAEDFSLILQRSPGCMAMLGTAPAGMEPAEAPPCHSNRMLLNEDAMPNGVALHAAVALDHLAG